MFDWDDDDDHFNENEELHVIAYNEMHMHTMSPNCNCNPERIDDYYVHRVLSIISATEYLTDVLPIGKN